MRVSSEDLRPEHDVVALIKALGRVAHDQQNELTAPLMRLVAHPDSDVIAEAVRVLGVRWKLQAFRPTILDLCVSRAAAPEVRQEALYGLAATSSSETVRSDSDVCIEIVCSDDADPAVRAAAYDALLVINRRAVFPTKQRAFDSSLDVDWEWVRSLRSEAGG